jgi:hypothetical protein
MKKLILLLALLSQPVTAATSLTLKARGWMVQGSEYFYNSTNSNATVQINDPAKDDVTFSFITPEYAHWWFVSFRPADGTKLKVGTYENAVRWHVGQNSRNTFDIYGDGRGSNQVGGWFEVLEIEWNPQHTELTKVAIDFHHLSEGIDSWRTDGAIRLNSNIPVPEVSSLGLILLSGLGLLRRTRR